MKIEFGAVSAPESRPLARTGDRLESAFLSAMLQIAMPDSADGTFGGGIGESQFSSFLTEQYADLLARRMDLGLTARLEAGHA